MEYPEAPICHEPRGNPWKRVKAATRISYATHWLELSCSGVLVGTLRCARQVLITK